MNTKNVEQVKLDLDVRSEEASTAKVAVEIGEAGDGWAKSTTEIYVSADKDDQQVWINIRQHTYASIGEGDLSTNSDIVSKHFTRAEAEALLAVLSHELGKL